MRLYRCKPVVDGPHAVPILITYALVGRFQMIDLEVDRSLVRKLLAAGLRRLLHRLGHARTRAALAHDRRLRIGLSRSLRRRHSRARRASTRSTCSASARAACSPRAMPRCFPEKVRNLAFTVTPIDFHGDKRDPQAGLRLHEPVGARADAGGHRRPGRRLRRRAGQHGRASRS